MRRFTHAGDWGRFHDPKSVILALVGEVGELADLFQWLPAAEARELALAEPLKTRAGEEVADVLLYLGGWNEYLRLARTVPLSSIPATSNGPGCSVQTTHAPKWDSSGRRSSWPSWITARYLTSGAARPAAMKAGWPGVTCVASDVAPPTIARLPRSY